MVLPRATSEETIHAERVVALREDDGTTELIFYAGVQRGGGFQLARRVILEPADAAALVGTVVQVESLADLVEGSQLRLVELDDDVIPTCHCGMTLMPSGWCANGHQPRGDLVEVGA